MTEVAEQFVVCGQARASERDAIVALIDMFRLAEASGGVLISGWLKVCQTPLLRGGLTMVAERELSHARMLEQRMDTLGAVRSADMDMSAGDEICAYFADPDIADLAKVQRFNQLIGDPEQTFAELKTLVSRIRDDVESRELLRLFHQDEISTALWMQAMEAQLTATRAQAA